MHFNEDFLIIEKKYIDNENKRFHPVITDLARRSQLMVRYELNDIVTEKKDCPCGNPMMAIEQIEGRSDDMLVFDTVNGEEVRIFPDLFRRAIIMSCDVEDFALCQIAKDKLVLFLTPYTQTALDAAANAITSFLQKQDVEGITISRAMTNGHEAGSKLRRIRNELYKTN